MSGCKRANVASAKSINELAVAIVKFREFTSFTEIKRNLNFMRIERTPMILNINNSI